MALIFGGDLAEGLLEDENLNIDKRFDTSLEELTKVINKATGRQQSYIYFLWQSRRNFKIYEVLKNLGIKTR